MPTRSGSSDIWKICNFKQEDAYLQKILKRKKSLCQESEAEGGPSLAKYLKQQPYFVKSVVVLINTWAVSSIPASERLKAGGGDFEMLARLVGIYCAQAEMAAVASEVGNCEPSLMRALIQCLETFSMDVNAVTVSFENADFKFSTSLRSSELDEINGRSGVILGPINPEGNYLETHENQHAWMLLQNTAARYFEYVSDVKSGLWPECVNDMCENLIAGRVQRIVRRTDGKAYVVLSRFKEPSFLSVKLMVLAVIVLILGLICRIYFY